MFNPKGPVVNEKELFSLNQSEKAYLPPSPIDRTLPSCPVNLLNGWALSLSAVYYMVLNTPPGKIVSFN